MNPELRRLLWLQVTSARLLLTPAAIFGATFLLHQSAPSASVIQSLALVAFLALTVIWGAREAADAVLDEARERTWEVQRMSALSPWTMTWGKLLGATAMPWYAGAMCLAIYLGYGSGVDGLAPDERALKALLVVLLAIALHGFALTTALVRMHQDRRLRSRLNILIVFFLLYLLLPELAGLTMPEVAVLSGADGRLSWYGHTYDVLQFNVVLAGAFAAWAVLGAWRMMCIELEVRTRPFMWLLFIAFLAWLSCGFVDGSALPDVARRWASTAAALACVLTYVAGFAFARDPVQYRRVLQALSDRRYRRALEEMPLWISSAAITGLLAFGATILGSDPTIDRARIDNLGPAALVLALMMVRDLSLLVYASFQQRNRRAEIVTLVYIALLNRLLPGIFALTGLSGITLLIKPPLFDRPLAAIVIMAVQAVVAGGLAISAFRREMRTPASRQG